jgi:glyoxylase-like metal-dependent hydrolase (beta-lactamase superfamily II)
VLAIEAVINTHFHADFAAGHLELAAATGAWIGYGRRAAEVEFRPAGSRRSSPGSAGSGSTRWPATWASPRPRSSPSPARWARRAA